MSITAIDTASTVSRASSSALVITCSTAQRSHFVADESSATIGDSDFTATSGAVANGKESNALKATVQDANGNPVADIAVTFAVTEGQATLTSATVKTNAQGVATSSLVSRVAGDNQVTAQVGTHTTAAQHSHFMADNSTAEITTDNLKVVSDGAKADGKATNSVTATVTDAHGNRVAQQSVVFAVDNGGTPGSQTVKTNEQGEATLAFSNTTAGVTAVRASINGAGPSVETTFVADESTAIIGENDFIADKGAVANGKESNALKATVQDANGNPVTDIAVTFAVTEGQATLTSATVKTNAQGVATSSLVSRVAGDNQVTAQVGTHTTAAQRSHFVADESSATIGDSDFTATSGAVANGTASNALKATVQDANGNPVADIAVTFAVTEGKATLTTATVKTNAQGVATASLVSRVAGDNQVTAQVGKHTTAAQHSHFVADKDNLDTAKSRLEAKPETIAADGSDESTITLALKDAHNNPVSGQQVSFNSSLANSVLSSVTDQGDGTYTATLMGTQVGKASITAQVNGTAFAVAATTVTLTADDSTVEITADNLKVVSDKAKADGKATNSVTATVTDAHGNRVARQNVLFKVGNGGTPDSKTVATNEQGEATLAFSNTTAGVTAVQASINGAGPSVETTFVADESTAIIGENDFTADKGAVANGKESNALKATVQDANGNPVTDIAVTFAVTEGQATLTSATVKTNAQGVATSSLVSRVAGDNQVTAQVGTHTTAAQHSHFMADNSTAEITADNLKVVSDGAKADGKATNSVTATVTDAQGNRVAQQSVVFAVDNGGTPDTLTVETNEQGEATLAFTNTTAGVTAVQATINGAGPSVETTFVADESTAEITADNLKVVSDGAKADGKATNSVTATVTDARGNRVAQQSVVFAVDNGGTPGSQTVKTNEQGEATLTFTNTTAGVTAVQATINGAGPSVETTFVADESTAEITVDNLKVVSDGAKADGKATNSVTATVTDAHGNRVAQQSVVFAVDNGGTPGSQTVKTNEQGEATLTFTNTTAGVTAVQATVNGAGPSVETTFVADESTAIIGENDFTADKGAVANGKESNALAATVQDANGNPVADIAVTFAVTEGQATLTSATVKTNAQGVATSSLVSRVAGDNQVTAQVGTHTTAAQHSHFMADNSTAEITADNLKVVNDGAKADGKATNSVTATVTDAQGNLVTQQEVVFAVDNGGTPDTLTVETNEQGEATLTFTNTTAGVTAVQATVNGVGPSVDTTFIEYVTDLTLSFSGDNKKAKIGDAITMVVTAKNRAGVPVSDANVSLAVSKIQNRQGVSVTSGALLFNGKTDSEFVTSADGTVTITVTDPNGTGVSRDITVTADAGTATESIIFTVVTSPDTPKANMWGHMADIVNGFSRPKLDAEVKGDISITESHEIWGIYNYASIITRVCGSEANLPSLDKIQTLYAAYPTGNMNTVHGWPIKLSYRTSTASPTQPGHYYSTNLKIGNIGVGVSEIFASCINAPPVAEKSTLIASPTTITADGTTESTLRLTLKDNNNDPVSGQTVTTGTLTGSAASGAKVGSWTESSDGVYTTPLTGTQAGTVTVLPQVNGGNAVGQGTTVTLTAPVVFTGISVNGYTFGLDDKFPSTGFANAEFQIQMSGAASGYSWRASQDWVEVDNAGKVSFTGTAGSTTKTVDITATPKGDGKPLVYTFTVQNWFTNNGNEAMIWSDAAAYCREQAQIQPEDKHLSSGPNIRAIGSLRGEWGDLSRYIGSHFFDGNYWSSRKMSEGTYAAANLSGGYIGGQREGTKLRVVCHQNL